jgi:hypothetical protein
MNAATSSIPEANGPSRNELLSNPGDAPFCDPTGPSVYDGVVSACPILAVPGTGVITANATPGWVPAGTRHHLLTRLIRAERPVTSTARSPTLVRRDDAVRISRPRGSDAVCGHTAGGCPSGPGGAAGGLAQTRRRVSG